MAVRFIGTSGKAVTSLNEQDIEDTVLDATTLEEGVVQIHKERTASDVDWKPLEVIQGATGTVITLSKQE